MTTALLLGILAKATGVLTLALVSTRLARTSRAAVRHLILAGAFGVLIGLPIASAIAPAIRVPVSVPVAAATRDDVGAQIIDAFVDAPPVLAPAAKSQDPPSSTWPSVAALVIAVWVAGIAICLAPVIGGLWQLRVLRRSALPWRSSRATIGQLAVDARIHRPVDVLLHEAVSGPMTFGVRQPIVVLPVDAPGWPEEELRRALIHEFEHVRRSDWISHALARVVTACYWFHPIAWAAWRQLNLEAERACDDAVLASAPTRTGSEATAYADQLVELAQRLSVSTRHPHLAMANRHDLVTRVRAVLDAGLPRGRAGLSSVAAAAAITVALAGALSAIRIVAAPSSQTTPAPTVPAGRPKFDAATIKPCQAEENPTGARGAAGGTNATFSPGRFFVPCVTTEQLIYLAYASYGAPESDHFANDDAGSASNATKIRGGPDWVHSLKEKYQIEAVAAGATERTVLMGSMLQSLLEDRFKLKTHRDTEQVDMLALTVAKDGFKLKPMKDGDCEERQPAPGPPSASAVNGKPMCGSIMMLGNGPNTLWIFGGFSPSSIAGQLSRLLGVHVIDRTGITDKFVMRLEFLNPRVAVDDKADLPGAKPDVSTVLQEEFGLKLEKVKGPRGFIVIDHIERPASASDEATPRPPARAQGAGQTPIAQAAAPRFDVVSIKPCDPHAPPPVPAAPVPNGMRRGGAPWTAWTSPGYAHWDCVTLAQLIYQAYGDRDHPLQHVRDSAQGMVFQPRHVRGGPSWIQTDTFTIEAKAPLEVVPGNAPYVVPLPGGMAHALRDVLENRFQLAVHRAAEDENMYALTVAKNGLNKKSMTEPTPGDCLTIEQYAANPTPFPTICGRVLSTRDRGLEFSSYTLARLAEYLSTTVDRFVLDRTGVDGTFNFSLKSESSDGASGDLWWGRALETLGLKLESTKAPAEFLFIDHAERPRPDEPPSAFGPRD
jgi:uncharacterized protein (TIGR03435 family)